MSKIAVITGASRGLGKSMALHLASEGVGIVGTFHRNRGEAETVASEVTQRGSKAAMLQLDVADSSSFDAFVASVRDALQNTFERSNFDYLVNNAGAGLRKSFVDTTEAELDVQLAIHVKAPFLLSQKLLPLIADGGRILNVSSGLARFTFPGSSAYASAKGAVEVLTRYMAKELGERQIRVNVVAPGAIATDFGGGVVRDNPQINQTIAANTALGRVGEADDIGAAVAALLSDGCGWINGTRIEVSGGQSL